VQHLVNFYWVDALFHWIKLSTGYVHESNLIAALLLPVVTDLSRTEGTESVEVN